MRAFDHPSSARLGEDVAIVERLVVTPTPGRISLPGAAGRPGRGWFVLGGDTIARVRTNAGEVAVTSPFQGWVMGFLVAEGQPVAAGAPVAWLREE